MSSGQAPESWDTMELTEQTSRGFESKGTERMACTKPNPPSLQRFGFMEVHL